MEFQTQVSRAPETTKPLFPICQLLTLIPGLVHSDLRTKWFLSSQYNESMLPESMEVSNWWASLETTGKAKRSGVCYSGGGKTSLLVKPPRAPAEQHPPPRSPSSGSFLIPSISPEAEQGNKKHNWNAAGWPRLSLISKVHVLHSGGFCTRETIFHLRPGTASFPLEDTSFCSLVFKDNTI